MYFVGDYEKISKYSKYKDVITRKKIVFAYLLNKDSKEDLGFGNVKGLKPNKRFETIKFDIGEYLKSNQTIGIHLILDVDSYYESNGNLKDIDIFRQNFSTRSEISYYMSLKNAIARFKSKNLDLKPYTRSIGVLQSIMIFGARIFPKGAQYMLIDTKLGTKVSVRRVEYMENTEETIKDEWNDISFESKIDGKLIYEYINKDPYSPTSVKDSRVHYLCYVHGLIKTASIILKNKEFRYEKENSNLIEELKILYFELIKKLRRDLTIRIIERVLKSTNKKNLNLSVKEYIEEKKRIGVLLVDVKTKEAKQTILYESGLKEYAPSFFGNKELKQTKKVVYQILLGESENYEDFIKINMLKKATFIDKILKRFIEYAEREIKEKEIIGHFDKLVGKVLLEDIKM
jgi:hypothetical protein